MRLNALVGGALLALSVTAPVFAQQESRVIDRDKIVLLENPSNGFQIFGELIEVTEDTYKVRTSVGDMLIPAAQVICTGVACLEAPGNAPTATSSSTSSSEASFTIAGSDTIGAELMPLLIKGYAYAEGAVVASDEIGERIHLYRALAGGDASNVLFSTLVEDKGSSTGFEALLSGLAELAMSSRPVKSEEVAQFEAAGYGDLRSFEQEHTIGVDGLIVIVHPDNPVERLTLRQISDLLSGAITNWSDVGGPDMPVRVYSRDNNSGTYATIRGKFLAPFSAELASGATIVPGNGEMEQAVYDDPGGIGYSGIAFRGDTKAVQLVESCGLSVRPTAFSTKTGEYPLQRSLYVYTRNTALTPFAAGLLDFATSSEADPIIEKAGFIDFDVEEEEQDIAAAAVRAAIETNTSRGEVALMRELYIDLQEWNRLSSTFRFRIGSSELDNAALRDLDRLVEHLDEDAKPGTRVMLVGFTDSDGPLEANVRLGEERAEAVRDQLVGKLGPEVAAKIDIEVKSYGEVGPVACNDDFEGQRLNRRVEAWIREQ